MRLAVAAQRLLTKLTKPRYRTYTVRDFFTTSERFSPDPEYVHVVMRVDIDRALAWCLPLAQDFQQRQIAASFYFLTNPVRYYDLWSSPVPRQVAEMGFEVGVHTDHYYEQLTGGPDAVEAIRADIRRLSDQIGQQVDGMVFHGHYAITSLGARNWDPYKFLPPETLGLGYHDGAASTYARPDVPYFQANTTYNITDYLGVQNGWRYWPDYPVWVLRHAKTVESIHIVIHPMNVYLPEGEEPNYYAPPPLPEQLKHLLRIRLRYQFLGSVTGPGSARGWLRDHLPFGFLEERLRMTTDH